MNGFRNIWILKPGGSSRGRGIVLYNSLGEIMDHLKDSESQYVAQKYIENPLIVSNRKFDIRIWVLVTDWNPLTVWMWRKPYVRLPENSYDPDSMDKYIHLTNNAIQKKPKKKKPNEDTAKKEKKEGEDEEEEVFEEQEMEEEFEGNMLFIEEFQECLQVYFFLTKQNLYGYDIWTEELMEKIDNLVIYSLKSVQDSIQQRKGSFELYGYDIMLDEECNPWLIEVNSSPSMEYSTV